MLSLTSPALPPPCSADSGQRTAVFLARMVMPRSRSWSIESITRVAWPSAASLSSGLWCADMAPAWPSRASTSVVLPWSTWAMMATFLKPSTGTEPSSVRERAGDGEIDTGPRLWRDVAGRLAARCGAVKPMVDCGAHDVRFGGCPFYPLIAKCSGRCGDGRSSPGLDRNTLRLVQPRHRASLRLMATQVGLVGRAQNPGWFGAPERRRVSGRRFDRPDNAVAATP